MMLYSPSVPYQSMLGIPTSIPEARDEPSPLMYFMSLAS